MIRLLCAILLWASPAWAATLPDYETCTLSWTFQQFNVYQQTSPTGPTVLMGRVGPESANDTTIKTFTFPCPTAKGTYYYSLTYQNAEGIEGPRNVPVAFTIKGGDPALVLAVGGTAQVNAQLLNVRASAGGAVLGTQRSGATAAIIGGPVTVMFQGVLTTFWQLDFATGVDGWCSQGGAAPLLVPIP